MGLNKRDCLYLCSLVAVIQALDLASRPAISILQAYKLENGNYTLVTATDTEFSHPDFPGLNLDVAELNMKPLPKFEQR